MLNDLKLCFQTTQLREQLKSRGLPVGGAKAVLVERLTESYVNEEKILNADVSMPKEGLGSLYFVRFLVYTYSLLCSF